MALRIAQNAEDAALGCILGSFLGDALGAPLEMKETDITPAEIEAAKQFLGGGYFNLGPAQVTDDSELAMCIMQGLKADPGVMNLDHIARFYAQWIQSEPRSLGQTIAKALVPLVQDPRASVALDHAKALCQESISNGGIMRMTPVCVWAHKLSDAEVVKAAQLEVSMTHSNPTVHRAAGCYALAAAHLINNLGDSQGAYTKAERYARSQPDELSSWFDLIEDFPHISAKGLGSAAKVGITYAFKALLEGSSYEDAVCFAVAQGGDTDTNAAIVGGLVGAVIGYSNLPTEWLQKVLVSAVHAPAYVSRPAFLDQSQALDLARTTFQLAPTKLDWVIDGQHHENSVDDVSDRALGSVFGAFIGDALGSHIEFIRNVTPELLESALAMPGGGPFRTGKGQATDDSELAMCLQNGLLEGNGQLNLDRIACYYGMWIQSHPFDIGTTTRAALGSLSSSSSQASVAMNDTRHYNQGSQSNGCLMRATPLGVWAYRLSDSQAAQAAVLECSMTHAHATVQAACACYALAIGHLLRHAEDRQGAYLRAKSYAQRCEDRGIQEWFTAIEDEPLMPGNPNMGYAKIAFTHAFKHLLAGSDYPSAMRAVLAIGGDTDTNAAIVGGLIGAAVGYSALPLDWRTKVETYTFETAGGQKRPSFLYQPSVKQKVLDLLTLAPETLAYVIDGRVTSV
jgi:ADP-ribosylglycohydrolase